MVERCGLKLGSWGMLMEYRGTARGLYRKGGEEKTLQG